MFIRKFRLQSIYLILFIDYKNAQSTLSLEHCPKREGEIDGFLWTVMWMSMVSCTLIA
jgi:hypothetical protein